MEREGLCCCGKRAVLWAGGLGCVGSFGSQIWTHWPHRSSELPSCSQKGPLYISMCLSEFPTTKLEMPILKLSPPGPPMAL